MNYVRFGLFLMLTVCSGASPAMTRVAYNHPGLVTDLGVGLWSWPLPMDFNGDGLMDLVVACTDRPSNGVYVFLNTGEFDPVTMLPLFAPATRLGAAGPSPQVSYVHGRPVVTTSGSVYPDFLQSGLDKPVALGDPTKIHIAEGRIRANQWKFVDLMATACRTLWLALITGVIMGGTTLGMSTGGGRTDRCVAMSIC